MPRTLYPLILVAAAVLFTGCDDEGPGEDYWRYREEIRQQQAATEAARQRATRNLIIAAMLGGAAVLTFVAGIASGSRAGRDARELRIQHQLLPPPPIPQPRDHRQHQLPPPIPESARKQQQQRRR